MKREEQLAILREDVVAAAPALLGATLVRGPMRARIVEVEAYRSDDPACHAFQRRTPRTEVMYGQPGIAYVYFSYGVHWMLNVVAHPPGDPAAILVRAAMPLEGLDFMRANRGVSGDRDLLSGPGKLAKAFGITGVDNGIDLFATEPSGLHIVPPDSPVRIVQARPRIGIAEGKWHDVPWRFIDDGASEWVSRRA
jgi:DNA-3-methyladenine glycosylase